MTDTDILVERARKEASRLARKERRAATVAAAKREKKDIQASSPKRVKLNKLTAISDVRPGKGVDSSKECFQCGGLGHLARNCPQKSR